jgi:hypothetical protein
VPAVDSTPCANCGALLPPAAGFCLACDTPVEGSQSGRLSVAESEPGAPVRRLPVLVTVVTGVAALALLTVLTVHWVGRHSSVAAGQAAGNAGHGLTLVVNAESGRGGVCRNWAHYVAGLRRDLEQECHAVADHDPGARLEDVREDPATLKSGTGTVTVRGTLVDDRGRRPFTRTVSVVDVNGQWQMNWDGRPVV